MNFEIPKLTIIKGVQQNGRSILIRSIMKEWKLKQYNLAIMYNGN